MQYCARGTKILRQLQIFSSLSSRELRIWHNESHENHNAKAEIQTRKPFKNTYL